MAENPEKLDTGEARLIVEHFKDKTGIVTNDILLEFCNRMGYTPVSADTYADYLYSYEFDRRMEAGLTDVLLVLSQIKWVPECASDKEREKIIDANAALSEELCFILEKNDIQYREVNDLTTKLATLVRGLFESASTRVNNMAAGQLFAAAEEKFGKPLTIKAMGLHQRGGKPFHNGLDGDNRPVLGGKWPDGCTAENTAGEGHTFLEGCSRRATVGDSPQAQA